MITLCLVVHVYTRVPLLQITVFVLLLWLTFISNRDPLDKKLNITLFCVIPDGDSANESSKTPDGENSMEFKTDPGFREALMVDSKHGKCGCCHVAASYVSKHSSDSCLWQSIGQRRGLPSTSQGELRAWSIIMWILCPGCGARVIIFHH